MTTHIDGNVVVGPWPPRTPPPATTTGRWVDAALVRPGDTLRGSRTGGTYTVLATDPDPDHHRVTLTLLSPTGQVRTWTRRDRFPLERSH